MKRKLSKRQLALIEDIFAGELDEQTMLQKHKLSKRTYDRWLSNEAFNTQLTQRMTQAHQQSSLIIARYGPLAAAKLVALTESDKPETARKACLDIIQINSQLSTPSAEAEQSAPQSDDDSQPTLSPETAGRILAALAEQ